MAPSLSFFLASSTAARTLGSMRKPPGIAIQPGNRREEPASCRNVHAIDGDWFFREAVRERKRWLHSERLFDRRGPINRISTDARFDRRIAQDVIEERSDRHLRVPEPRREQKAHKLE